MKEYQVKIIKALFVATILLLLNILVYATNKISCSSDCLGFRNEIITISDVKNDECFSDVVPVEISDLREILKPLELTNETPRLSQETKQYEIIAKVKSYFKYQNGCYKLILYQPDDTISYISAIIINPSCLQNNYGKYYDKIKETYINFNTYTKAQFKDKKVYYRIRGAGFYSNERPINRYGLDNGFQLAPIFSFKKF